MTHGLLYWLGMSDASGRPYLFWSGWFSDVGLLVGAAAVMRHKNCHRPRCWRLGKHPAGPFTYCRRHHPDLGDFA